MADLNCSFLSEDRQGVISDLLEKFVKPQALGNPRYYKVVALYEFFFSVSQVTLFQFHLRPVYTSEFWTQFLLYFTLVFFFCPEVATSNKAAISVRFP